MTGSVADLRLAIVGATGAVGAVALQLLADRRHPAHNIKALASHRSAGRRLPYLDTHLVVEEATPESFDDVDVAFISASSAVSRALAPEVVNRGGLVIDDGSAFRMQDHVPLVVPEVNGEDVEWHNGIISIPNCTTTPLVMTLAALRQLSDVLSVSASTYQSVTGTGTAAREELAAQSRAVLADGDPVPPSVYPKPIAFNVIPQVDDFDDEGYTVEEHKMVNETKKILHDSSIAMAATCVRVPVEVGHCETVAVKFADGVDVDDARAALSEFDGIEVVDDRVDGGYPTALDAAGRDAVLVGRVRRDMSAANGLIYWIACDNLRKGAALNALQILDECVRRGRVKSGSSIERV